MNRPTDELENLLSLADEALAEGDYNDAVMILRRAVGLAPLRRDIKNRLAVALEGAPMRSAQTMTAPAPARKPEILFDDDSTDYDDYEDAGEAPALEPVSNAARKAFKAAADTTGRAATASRNLSDLLQNGIKSWKSSLMDHIQPVKNTAHTPEFDPAPVTAATEAGLFTAPEDLNSYIGTPSTSSVSTYTPPTAAEPAADEIYEVEEDQLIKPATVSRKAKTASTRKSNGRPTDMEDVIAAGIGSLIEAFARTNKRSFVYAGVYMIMGALITLACVDTSKKFPGVQAVPGSRGVAAASLGGLDFSDTGENPITRARHLVSIGKTPDAIALLKNEMTSGAPKASVDPIRVELAAHLNGAAEEKLRSNQLKESANLYREAVGVMPGDSGLSLRLANALYYLAIMDTATSAEKKATLAEGREILDGLITKGSDNVQVYRLMALLYEAEGSNNQAKASWQKVKAMAAANSAERTEAEAHLK